MAEFYSRSLSPEARAKLIDFVEAYLETLVVQEVDAKAQIAKQKAMEVLQTDIDIAVFGMTFVTILAPTTSPLVDRLGVKEAAKLLVEVVDVARQDDKSRRLHQSEQS